MSAIITGRVFWTEFKDLSYQNGNKKTIGVKETTAKIVMLAIADSADDYGENSYQSFERIAKKASIDRRSAVRVVNALVKNNYLRVAGLTKYGTNNFSINLDLLGNQPPARAKNGRPKTSDSVSETSDSVSETSDPQSPYPSYIPSESSPLSIENAIAAGKPVTEEMVNKGKSLSLATKQFENALGFSKPLPWGGKKEWTDFAKWVVDRYAENPLCFGEYNVWRGTPYTRGGMTNNRIRGFVKEFYDSWDMFMMSKQSAPSTPKTDLVADQPWRAAVNF